MSPTKVTSIRIDEQLLIEAKELGLNLSQICSQAIQGACNTGVIQNEHNPENSLSQNGNGMLRTEGSPISQMPRWPSWLGHRLGKAEVAGSNPARGFTPCKGHK